MLRIVLVFIYIPLAIEGLFRILAPVPMMPRYVDATSYGIRGNMANQDYHHKTAEYKIRIQTNSKGMRADYEIAYEKPPNLKRVVILGDSFGMGYGVNAHEMFTTKMAEYLKTKYYQTIEIVNLSTSGHGNAEELIVLLNEGFKYSPDLVLLAWHYTDLKDNVRSNLFKLVDGKLTRNAESYLPGVKERRFLNQFSIYRFLAEHSQIYNYCRNWAGTKVQRWLAKARLKKINLKQKGNGQIVKKNTYKEELTISLLKRIEQECNKMNSRFLILDIPSNKSRSMFISRFPYKYAGNANPFHIVSPIDKFKVKSKEQIYWEKGDLHFTPFGCDIVGEILADYIEHHDLLTPH